MADSVTAKPDRTWLYVGVAFAAFWAVYLIFFNPDTPLSPPGLSAPALALPAEYQWPLEDLEGNPIDFGSFRGRPIVLNVWATWCGPCREEMPSLVRLAANPRLKGVAFVCVTGENATAAAKRFAQSDMKGLTVVHAEGIPPVFATEGIPATFVISPQGTVVASEVGAASWDDPSVVEFLEKLLAGAPKS